MNIIRIQLKNKRDIKAIRKVILLLNKSIKLGEQCLRRPESKVLEHLHRLNQERYESILFRLAAHYGFNVGDYKVVAPCDDLKSIVVLR